MAKDIYYYIKNKKIFRVEDYDGPSFMRKGSSPIEEEIFFSEYKHDDRLRTVVFAYEKLTGIKLYNDWDLL